MLKPPRKFQQLHKIEVPAMGSWSREISDDDRIAIKRLIEECERDRADVFYKTAILLHSENNNCVVQLIKMEDRSVLQRVHRENSIITKTYEAFVEFNLP